MAKEKKEIKDPREQWELEEALDYDATLEEMVNSPPFKKASDEKGHSVTAGTRLPMWLVRRAQKLKEMSNSPYEIISDVYRDAMYLGLWVLSIRFRYIEDWRVEARMASAISAAGVARHVREQVQDLSDGLEDLEKEDDHKMAVSRLQEYVRATMELNSAWRQQRICKLLRENKTVMKLVDDCELDVKKYIADKTENNRRK